MIRLLTCETISVWQNSTKNQLYHAHNTIAITWHGSTFYYCIVIAKWTIFTMIHIYTENWVTIVCKNSFGLKIHSVLNKISNQILKGYHIMMMYQNIIHQENLKSWFLGKWINKIFHWAIVWVDIAGSSLIQFDASLRPFFWQLNKNV